MEIVWTILMEAGRILFFLLVLTALVVSALILFKPQWAARLNGQFNRMFSTRNFAEAMESVVSTRDTILRHRGWVGGLFLLGALYTLKVLGWELDEEKLVQLVFAPSGKTSLVLTQILVATMKWVLIVTSVVCVGVCLLLLVQPRVFVRLSEKLDAVISTRSIQDAVDASYHGLDGWVLRNHVPVGLFLFLGSLFLVFFCATTLL